MSDEAQPDANAYLEAKQALLKYFYEKVIECPFEQYPFVWPEPEPRLRSPSPSFDEIFPNASTYAPVTEEPHWEADIDNYVKSVLQDDVEDVGLPSDNLRSLRCETPVLPATSYPNRFRPYGPDTLAKCGNLLKKEMLQGDKGLEIPTDMKEVDQALEQDKKIAVSAEAAAYFKDLISKSSSPPDYIPPKVQLKQLILTPPLLPYTPPLSQEDFINEPLNAGPLAPPKFNEDLLLTSEDMWDDISSPSSSYLGRLLAPHKLPSPTSVQNKETEFLAKLKAELPITSIFTKPSPFRPQALHNSEKIVSRQFVTAYPESPSTSIQEGPTVDKSIFNERVSAESILRLPVPEIPPFKPMETTYPKTMFGIFMGEDGLQCRPIARSILDSLNETMKWQPFTKVSFPKNLWIEEIEGDWESYLDYMKPKSDTEASIFRQNTDEKEEPLLASVISLPGIETDAIMVGTEFEDVLEIVKKRTSSDIDRQAGSSATKRLKWSQTDRMEDYMRMRGLHVEHHKQALPEGGSIRTPVQKTLAGTSLQPAIRQPEQTTRTTELPPQPHPSQLPPAIILSTTSLPLSVTQDLRRTFVETIFVERDLKEDQSEGDIIPSPHRCIIFFSVAQITQVLPSRASTRIQSVASKYREIELVITEISGLEGTSLSAFSEWLKSLREICQVRTVLTRTEEEMLRWTAWLCRARSNDESLYGPDYLTEDETEVLPQVTQTNYRKN